ncbi:MAG: 4-(cytidine 5'-diphospho)-2-C-methyl-D-erythritol kinase [Candidatus Stahlbacteria bacterium]|nr:MAG: 4-(cytidine 5'-diphospho)-2-C-methyl-D-erythritol kinase [Candidatus Stahlbacteria bacterium]
MVDLGILPSFAKINLGLNILGKREDGYHSIESIFQTISLHDNLHFKLKGDCIEVTSDDEMVPDGPSNLIYKAAKMFEERTGNTIGLKVSLEKKIPVQSGLGGGSSNAATTLLTLNRFFGYPLSLDELTLIASELGSDVPFFIRGGTAYVTGRGEQVQWKKDIPGLYILLIFPSFGISTEWAYSRWDKNRDITLTNKKLDIILNLLINNEKKVIRDLRNSFAEIIVKEYPQVKLIIEKLEKFNPMNIIMSGSGPTLCAIFGSESKRDSVREILIKSTITMSCRAISRKEYLNSLKLKED